MSFAIWLAPLGLGMGLIALVAFLWSIKSGQLEDLEGAAHRVLLNEEAGIPLQSDDHVSGAIRKERNNG